MGFDFHYPSCFDIQGRLQGFLRTGAQLKEIPGFSQKKAGLQNADATGKILKVSKILAPKVSLRTAVPGVRGTRTTDTPDNECFII